MSASFLMNTDGFQCWLAVLVFVVLVIILAILAYVLGRLRGKKTSSHYCRYCGHLNPVVSDCCGARVQEKFMTGKCQACGKECRIICASCRRPIH